MNHVQKGMCDESEWQAEQCEERPGDWRAPGTCRKWGAAVPQSAGHRHSGAVGTREVRPARALRPPMPGEGQPPKARAREVGPGRSRVELPCLYLREERIQALPIGGEKLGRVPNPVPVSQRRAQLQLLTSQHPGSLPAGRGSSVKL